MSEALSLTAAIGIFAVMAWCNRWIQDDAFISFRYAHHIVEGIGPVWNKDQRVEGYTNFLWVLVIAIGEYIGVPPEPFSFAVGVALFSLSLATTYMIAKIILESKFWSFIAVVLVGTNYSFFMYATGGLETQLNVALILLILLLTVQVIQQRSIGIQRAFWLSVLASLAVLTRPDSILPAAIFLTLSGFTVLKEMSASRLDRAKVLVALLLPIASIIGTWLAWKRSFYGTLLPNTFYAKVTGNLWLRLERGLIYVGWLFVSYWW